MLLAMYYNGSSRLRYRKRTSTADRGAGYIIFSIIIGAFLGSFIFSWDQLRVRVNQTM
ncbi:MAG: hypothetical protein Q9159_002498 [Coniocarpon cinnabarinum]